MQPTQDTSDVSIAEYVEVLKRRWLWIVLTPIVLVAFSLFTDLRAQPVYSAQAELLLQSNVSEDIFRVQQPVATPERALQNEIRVINSRIVRDAAEEAYGAPVSVRALAGGDDDIIILSARANTGEEAAERVNTYATAYQEARLDSLLSDLTNAKKIVQQQIDDFQAQVEEIDAPLAALDAEIRTLTQDDPRYSVLVAQRELEKNRTDAARNEAQNQLNDYQQRLQVLQLSERLTTTGGVQILNPATVPSSPISPTTVRNALQAMIIGLLLGVGLAFLRDQLDDSLRSKADVERAVRDLPTLSIVPFGGGWRDNRPESLITLTAPMSATAEAYRGLRTSIQYAALDRPMNTIQVTSPSAGEGKTTMMANLAVAFAQAGKRVAVVGCDLRRPRVGKLLGVDPSVGFTSVVLGDLSLEEAIQTSPLHPNIDVLAAGPLPPNPSELLSHDRTGKILASLSSSYSMVFVDCPPVLAVTDALVLGRHVDATLFIVMANRTTRRTSRRAVEMLRQVGSPLLGTVLVGVAGEDTYGSLYEYYGYAVRKPGLFSRLRGKQSGDAPSLTEDVLPHEGPESSAGAAGPSARGDGDGVSTGAPSDRDGAVSP